jgi:NAD(P)-dependent dehydrogenase (short-subunit alcohol dehydrogenase family)
MSIERALVIGANGGVGNATVSVLTDAGTQVLSVGRERDTTDPGQVVALLDEADPDLVVVAVGARPRMAPIDEHDWESFSEVWNVDVRITFEVGRAALARPLRPGSTVAIVSSGAGLRGSPLSGGYAGAKRMQMFLASYFRRAAEARELGIRFVALAPQQFLVGTRIGEAAAEAYGAEVGVKGEDYIQRFPAPLEPAGVARAILSIASGEEHGGATVLGVTAGGLNEIEGAGDPGGGR